jgi:WD40 repeat protein
MRRELGRWAGLAVALLGVTPFAGAAPPSPSAKPAAAPAPAALAPVPARPAPVWALAFSGDGKRLAAGGYRQVQVWDVEGRALSQTLTGASGPVRCLAWSPDGKVVAGGTGLPGESGEVKLWDAAAGAGGPDRAPALKLHKDVVEGLAFSAAGDTIVTASEDERALATQIASEKVLQTMGDHTNRVTCIAVAPNGRYVATGSLDRTVKIWSGSDFKPLANLDANVGQVYCLAFLPAGDQLAVAGEDGNVRIFRLSESRTGRLTGLTGQVVQTINGNRTPVFTLAVGGKGPVLAWGGADKTVYVRDLTTRQRQTLKECPEAVYAVAVSPDGALVAAGSRDGQVRLWTAADGKLAATLPGG